MRTSRLGVTQAVRGALDRGRGAAFALPPAALPPTFSADSVVPVQHNPVAAQVPLGAGPKPANAFTMMNTAAAPTITGTTDPVATTMATIPAADLRAMVEQMKAQRDAGRAAGLLGSASGRIDHNAMNAAQAQWKAAKPGFDRMAGPPPGYADLVSGWRAAKPRRDEFFTQLWNNRGI